MGLPYLHCVALRAAVGRKRGVWAGAGGGDKKKNTLQEDYAPSMPSLLQEFVIPHLVCKCVGGNKIESSGIVCACLWFSAVCQSLRLHYSRYRLNSLL